MKTALHSRQKFVFYLVIVVCEPIIISSIL